MKLRLTPNRRMAIYLKAHNSNIEIDSIGQWLESLYDQYAKKNPKAPVRLNDYEVLLLWEKVITHSSLGDHLLHKRGTAVLARDAWVLSNQFQCGSISDSTAMQETEDSRIYRYWAKDYQALCRGRWVDSATMVDILIQLIQNQEITLPQEIELIGFNEINPQWQLLLDEASRTGSRVTNSTLTSKLGDLSVVGAKDRRSEFYLAAKKVKSWISSNAKASIGVIVLDLESNREKVLQVFSEILPLETINISAPIPLSRYPIISTALLALSLLQGKQSIEKWSLLLRSPFLGGGTLGLAYRSALDIFMREGGEESLSANDFLLKLDLFLKKNLTDFLESPEFSGFPGFQKLKSFASFNYDFFDNSKAFYMIKTVLDLLGFANDPELGLSLEEKESLEQWEELFKNCIAMEKRLGGSIVQIKAYSDLVTQLYRLAENTPFLPKRKTANIQVLGLLEGIGITFDYLWVVGLDKDSWPQDPIPNPFIPIRLQIDKKMPRCSAARELEMARKFTNQLFCGAKEVIFSYPLMLEKGIGKGSISSLLSHLPQNIHSEEVLKENNNSDNHKIHKDKDKKINNDFFPLQANEKVLGGARLLKLQALCPFRAFSEIRLNAKPIPQSTFGLTPMERGDIIHAVLEGFWKGYKGLEDLKNLPETILQEKLKTTIDFVFRSRQNPRFQLLVIEYPEYIALEKERTFKLVFRWIEFEKKRAYFEVVSHESKKEVLFEGLPLKIRIDRIDRLANGEEVLIDYKTSDPSLNDWLGERPRDPQLPFYGITHEKKPSGIAFGVLRPEKVKMIEMNDSHPHWETQYEMWETSLQALAQEFKSGVTTVAPLEGERTCQTCALQSFCRVETGSCTSNKH